eukprot:CAMPEP_0195146520 /NCGR_PEP_ID=MMETSP0448-20130528/171791_1 /TAXON_ID=66468 /ORGANISM="Heterocapsa triquestra, Strain CCMP 448" /LENGTH=204 /DNA_ID=CAMNT_0040185071 /DNA_START=303 /DNA_END=914 /DNA_ORIENTATION=-
MSGKADAEDQKREPQANPVHGVQPFRHDLLELRASERQLLREIQVVQEDRGHLADASKAAKEVHVARAQALAVGHGADDVVQRHEQHVGPAHLLEALQEAVEDCPSHVEPDEEAALNDVRVPSKLHIMGQLVRANDRAAGEEREDDQRHQRVRQGPRVLVLGPHSPDQEQAGHKGHHLGHKGWHKLVRCTGQCSREPPVDTPMA